MKSALLRLSPLLHEADPMWCVYGSCALALNGVPGVDVHDVDILLSSGGVHRLMQQVEHVCLTDGIRYASLPDCVRLLRQFGRPKDFTRLELVDAACSQGLCAWPASHPSKP